MKAFRAVVIAAFTVVMLWAPPSIATKDFRDIGFLYAKVSEALEREPTGTVVPWSNPTTGNGGRIIVTRTYFLGDGAPCREYTRTTDNPGGPPDRATGTGCRDDVGHWSLNEGFPESGSPVSLTPPAAASTATPAIATEPLPPASPRPIVVAPPSAASASPAPASDSAPAPVTPAGVAEASPRSAAEPNPIVASATMPSRSD